MAIGVVLLSSPPQAAIKAACARAAISPAIRFIVTSLSRNWNPMYINLRLRARHRSTSPLAPGKHACPLVEPAVLRDHLCRAHGAETEARRRKEHSIGDEIIIEREERAVEQGVVKEADGGGEQRHIEKYARERLPRPRQPSTGKKSRAAPDDHGEREEHAQAVVGEPGHCRAPGRLPS